MSVEDRDEMSAQTIHVVYDGTPLADGSMDVRDLAPALLSIGELCQEVNRQLYGSDSAVSVRVRADFQKGSFGVDLEVVRTLIEQAKDFLHSADTQAVESLVEIIFGGSGIFAFLKWLRGRKNPSSTTLENGSIKIEISGDGDNHIEVKSQVYRLANEPNVRKHIDGAIQPLKNPGMTKMEVTQHNRTLQTVQKEEVPYLSIERVEDQALETDGCHEAVRIAYLEIIKLSFKQGNKWSFSDGSGGGPLSVGIEDQEFQTKVDRRQYSFGKGDQLKVSLKTRTTRLPSGKYQAVHTIVTVLEVIPSPQTDMFNPG